jgi:hypothetical protein
MTDNRPLVLLVAVVLALAVLVLVLVGGSLAWLDAGASLPAGAALLAAQPVRQAPDHVPALLWQAAQVQRPARIIGQAIQKIGSGLAGQGDGRRVLGQPLAASLDVRDGHRPVAEADLLGQLHLRQAGPLTGNPNPLGGDRWGHVTFS